MEIRFKTGVLENKANPGNPAQKRELFAAKPGTRGKDVPVAPGINLLEAECASSGSNPNGQTQEQNTVPL